MIEISIAFVLVSLIALYGFMWYVKYMNPVVKPSAHLDAKMRELQTQVDTMQSEVNKLRISRGFMGVINE